MKENKNVFEPKKAKKTRANPKGVDLIGHPLSYIVNGAELSDTTPLELPLDGYELTSSADEKLKLMIAREVAKTMDPEIETVEDAENFDLDDASEFHRNLNKFRNVNLKGAINEFKQEVKKRKSPKSQQSNESSKTTESVVNDKDKQKPVQFAAEGPTEGAN